VTSLIAGSGREERRAVSSVQAVIRARHANCSGPVGHYRSSPLWASARTKPVRHEFSAVAAPKLKTDFAPRTSHFVPDRIPTSSQLVLQ